MFIVYEYAVCVLAVSVGTTMLFTAYAMFLLLIEGIRMLAQGLHKLGAAASLSAAKQTDGGVFS